jgi:hypothetical protein
MTKNKNKPKQQYVSVFATDISNPDPVIITELPKGKLFTFYVPDNKKDNLTAATIHKLAAQIRKSFE